MEKSEDEFAKAWARVEYRFISETKKKPDLNIILFLIGIQELGKGKKKYTKEQKQDLMHLGICKVLSYSGYYELDGVDQDGWPHWTKVRDLPRFDLLEQEKFLKAHIIEYFSEIGL